MRGIRNLHGDVLAMVRVELERVTQTYKPKAKMRHCLNCGASFAWNGNDGRVFCEPKCGRAAHYVKFKVSALRRELAEKEGRKAS